MLELADEVDSKSIGGDTVRVRPPPPAPKRKDAKASFFFFVGIARGERVFDVFLKEFIIACG